MKNTKLIGLYDKIYRIWMYGGGQETIGYDKDNNPIVAESVSGKRIWDFGVKVGEREYTLETLQEKRTENGERAVPCNYAQLLAGECDVIKAICDAIVYDFCSE